eukprot:CAMPEP_0172603494 /NCGR_PEP_ID=MMETSP1068-20121228/23746_1 /TAXON_ID=35684 /ORGANISM="Pseudopedinella elastica, Strain CCMP716" /LENGTH=42 /DNA_ID= /DNA_START= /DNA_END= /DNA_ORIENTATION=
MLSLSRWQVTKLMRSSVFDGQKTAVAPLAGNEHRRATAAVSP